jgi:hypothetical protein
VSRLNRHNRTKAGPELLVFAKRVSIGVLNKVSPSIANTFYTRDCVLKPWASRTIILWELALPTVPVEKSCMIRSLYATPDA